MFKKSYLVIFSFLFFLLCGSFLAQEKARKIIYSPEDIVFINCKVRNTTCIILPRGEKILDFTVGDKDFWIVEGVANFCWVKPAKVNSKTNINLVCSSGMVYSFVLTEVTKENKDVDYKVFVVPKDIKLLKRGSFKRPSFVSVEDLEFYKMRVKEMQKEIEEIEERTEEEIKNMRKKVKKEMENYKSNFLTSLDFNYKYKRNKKPFYIKSIFTDGKFTYVKCNPSELPALYEIKDGKPNLIQFKFFKNLYIVPKLIEEGYFQIGKKKMYFKRS